MNIRSHLYSILQLSLTSILMISLFAAIYSHLWILNFNTHSQSELARAMSSEVNSQVKLYESVRLRGSQLAALIGMALFIADSLNYKPSRVQLRPIAKTLTPWVALSVCAFGTGLVANNLLIQAIFYSVGSVSAYLSFEKLLVLGGRKLQKRFSANLQHQDQA